MDKNCLKLEAIFVTHKHRDHTGGIIDIAKHWPGVKVFGPFKEPIKGVNFSLKGGDVVSLKNLKVKFEVIDVPGHTEGHIAFYGENALFCGDTLFSCGCGRVFSGTYRQLSISLSKLLKLPEQTYCYCGHEYTEDNIGFAKLVEPTNVNLLEREHEVKALRSKNKPTLPSTLIEEAQINPFMRTNIPEVKIAAEKWIGHELKDTHEVFHALRTWKDKDYD